jgi:hypothetical protein
MCARRHRVGCRTPLPRRARGWLGDTRVLSVERAVLTVEWGSVCHQLSGRAARVWSPMRGAVARARAQADSKTAALANQVAELMHELTQELSH